MVDSHDSSHCKPCKKHQRIPDVALSEVRVADENQWFDLSTLNTPGWHPAECIKERLCQLIERGTVRGKLRLAVERDRNFVADKMISA